MRLLIPHTSKVSQPITIPKNETWTFLATGLGAGDTVTFEIVSLTTAGPASDNLCCPGAVSLPNIAWRVPLRMSCGCDPAQVVTLTEQMPYVVLSKPRGVSLLLTVNDASPMSLIEVYAETTADKGCGLDCLC